MSNELATISNTMSVWEDEKNLVEIRAIFAPTLTDLEFKAFVGMGKQNDLNPFLREIWAVKYDKTKPAQIFIGRDGYRKSAQRNPNYDYHQSDSVYTNDTFEMVDGTVRHSYKLINRGELIGGYCVVQRRSSTKPMYVYVNLKDYDKKQSCWNQIKATMIAKVAEAQCLRMSFQEQFAGTLSEYENTITIDATWEPRQSQQDKMNALLAKKGLKNDAIESNAHHDAHPHDSAYDTGLCNANSNPSPQDSESEVCPTLVKDGESKDRVTLTQNVPMVCSMEQLENIEMLCSDKGFAKERQLKALDHFNVSSFAELNVEQADEMIKILHRIE